MNTKLKLTLCLLLCGWLCAAMAGRSTWLTGKGLPHVNAATLTPAANAADITISNSKAAAQAPTFNKEVIRILQTSCQTCHRPGEIAPFSLLTYRDVRPWTRAIREAVITREMPPWKAQAGCGDFKDSRALTQEQINTIVAWADAGAPEGNAADLPAPRVFSDSWPKGTPDVVLAPAEKFTPPQGKDSYRCFSIPVSQLRGDRFIQGLDVLPGNRKIVHHVLAYSDPTGKSKALDQADAGEGYSCFGGPGFDIGEDENILGSWVPGAPGEFAPEGTGIKLPINPEARVVIEMHYHPSDEPESDRTQVGLYFAQKPVNSEAYLLPLLNDTFTIPAGNKNYAVTASETLPNSTPTLRLLSVQPHMHLLGRQMKVEVKRPREANAECLINITDWDFNWQGSYSFKTPVAVPGGSQLKFTAIYDNSADNPRNPNAPPKPVQWGEMTTDEMALVFLRLTIDGVVIEPSTPALSEAFVNNDGKLIVSGTGWLPGADLVINGQRLRDTQLQNGQLVSEQDWKIFAAPGQAVDVTVRNADGRSATARKFTRTGTARLLAATSAASYQANQSAPGAIIAIFGTALANATMVASTLPLPTEIGGTVARINGVAAPLFFVSPGQLNVLVPDDTALGNAVIEVEQNRVVQARGALTLNRITPGIFTANAQGKGAPAALGTRDGVNFYEIGNANGTPNPINIGDFLVLFGTGLRASNKDIAQVTIGGKAATVLFAGAQGQLAGLDQLNVQIPSGINGLVDTTLTINGRTANTVKLQVR